MRAARFSLVSNAGECLDIARLGKSRSAAAGLTTKRQLSGGTEEWRNRASASLLRYDADLSMK
jgi:hypothetical protein